MANINIQKYQIYSSLGDLSQTVDAIKNNNIKISTKTTNSMDGKIEVPYYLLEKNLQDNQDAIYDELKKIIQEFISDLNKSQKESTAIILGSSMIDLNTIEVIESDKFELLKPKKISIDSYAKQLSKEFGLNDFTMSISTSCTSSANAILEAKNMILAGVFENVIVLGIEIFSQMMNNGFNSMQLFSQDILKPFDKNQNGLVLGEALAGILISKKKSSFSLEGGFSNCNSLNITSSSEDGHEFVEVMQNALKDSNLHPKDITAIKAHATGTLTNDLAEINAISEVFNNDIIFTALKPYVGHTLGASGVLELSIFIKAIENGFIPKTINSNEPLNKEYTPLEKEKECSGGIFMLNYFGFGGNNTSLIIKKETI